MSATQDKYTNYASTTIGGGTGGLGTALGISDLTVIAPSGQGALFPSAGNYTIELSNAAGTLKEIVKCSARSSDSMTIVRAQEGTTALAWPVGSIMIHKVSALNMTNLWNRVQKPTFHVDDYGAVHDGVTSDTNAINAAISDAGAAGGIVQFGPYTYAHASTLTLGNGTTGGASTTNGISMRGAGVDATTLKWTGAGSGTMAKIAGVCSGMSFGDMTLDGNSSAGIGIDVVSGQYANWGALHIKNTIIACLKLECLASFSGTLNTLQNHFPHLRLEPAAGTVSVQSHGLWLAGSSGLGGDSNNNTFASITIRIQATYQTGLRLGYCDFNTFGMVNMFASANTGVISLNVDGAEKSGFPGNNNFVLLNCGIDPTVGGTPGLNYVEFYDTADGASTIPSNTSGLYGMAGNPLSATSAYVPFGKSAAVNIQSESINQQITTTGATTVCTLTSPPDGLYLASLYIRQTNAGAVTITASAFVTDDTGSQQYRFFAYPPGGGAAQTLLAAASMAQNSYACISIPLRYVGAGSQKPLIQITCGTANVVFVTGSITKIG